MLTDRSRNPPDDRSDQQLVAAINQGDDEAFRVLYERYRDWGTRLAWRFTGHHDDAQDVLQETFAYLVRKFPGFELTCAMTTFLYPAIRHLALAASQRRRRLAGSEQVPDVSESPPQQSRAEGDDELSVWLSSLSPQHREILLMRFVDDMTQPEIAAALNLPLGTVKSRLHHATQAAGQALQRRRGAAVDK